MVCEQMNGFVNIREVNQGDLFAGVLYFFLAL